MKSPILLTILGSFALAPPAWSEESGGLDWTAWQRMPVLQDGRIMPLDSFARAQVKKICGDVRPSLGKIGAKTSTELASLSAAEIHGLAIEGKLRRFLAAEILYSWIVEPEKWDDVPFILADDAELRNKLDVPLVGEDGSRLTHVSPRQIRLSKEFAKVNGEIEAKLEEAQKTKKKPIFTDIQGKVRELDEARQLFFQFGYDPGRLRTSDPWWLLNDFVALRNSWDKFAESLMQDSSLTEPPDNLRVPDADEHAQHVQGEFLQLAERTNQAVRELTTQLGAVQSRSKPIQSLEPAAVGLRKLAFALDAKMRELAESDLPDRANLIEDNTESIESNRQNFSRWARSLALQAAQLPWDLYSAGDEAISIVPAMEATALEPDRYRSEIRPWMSLNALLRGSPALLHGYPADRIQEIRTAWRDARAAYLQRGNAEAAGQFSATMQLFSTGMRGLSEAIEPVRQQLPIKEHDRDSNRDRDLLAKTAYPAAVKTDAEVLYNYVDPFRLSGWASLAAACIIGLSCLFGSRVSIRNATFWLGSATLVASVLMLAGGFVVRMYITRWAPVTSMFETIVWVSMVSALLTLWVTFLPLLGPTSKTAWGLTAIPGSWEDTSRNSRRPLGSTLSDSPQDSQAGDRSLLHDIARGLALAMRAALFLAGLFVAFSYMGVFVPDTAGNRFHLDAILPRADLGSSQPNLSASLVWAASMFVASAFVWYLPRVIPSALLAIPMSLALARREEAAERMEKVYRTRVVTLAGAVTCFFAALAALYAPFPRDIQALMPVLRSNFWLGIHVLTITSSYAAVGVSWVIGNVALGFFAFGRYRTVDGDRRPPAFCGVLASMNYRVLQVAVLLITAGTILGGLWADVSWGRFWGWDPKEVGALTALLIMMTALHGRRAGWHGDLSLAIGSIWGFFGVIWAWYVVNFILNAGKHAYGNESGEVGQWLWLIGVVSVQSLYMAVAIARVSVETRRPVEVA